MYQIQMLERENEANYSLNCNISTLFTQIQATVTMCRSQQVI